VLERVKREENGVTAVGLEKQSNMVGFSRGRRARTGRAVKRIPFSRYRAGEGVIGDRGLDFE
jgi:hypothetical protein